LDAIFSQRPVKLGSWHLAEELRNSVRSEDFFVLEITICRSRIRLKHIDCFPEAMFKAATDRILLLILARRDCQNVITDSGCTQLSLGSFLLER